MARGLPLTTVTVVVVVVMGMMMGGSSAFQKFHSYQGPPTMFFPPTYYNAPPILPPFLYSAGPVQAIRVAVDNFLPCPDVGFYVHPTNCSRFYRCVDHTGTRRFFVRYIFECSKNHIFVEEVETCLPGTCDGTTPPVQPLIPSTDPPVQSTEPTVKSTEPPVQPTEPPVQSTEPTVQPTDPPIQPTEPAVQPPPPPPSEGCKGQYVQHDQYCNIYRRCNETLPRYACPTGTVFDAPRQMCRISAADESLCEGKVLSKFPHSLRTELVDGHIRIPDDYVLTPLVPFLPQTIPGIAQPLHAFRHHPLPPGSPYTADTSYSPSLFFGPEHANPPEPYHALPADTLPPQSLSLVRSRPFTSPYSASTFHSVPSVNNVRRPQNHLHFPFGVPEVDPYPYYGGVFVR